MLEFRTELRTNGSISLGAANTFNAAVGGPTTVPNATAEEILESALDHIHAADALRLACATGPLHRPQLQPKTPEEIAAAAFPASPVSIEATEGLLAGLSSARGITSTAPLPLRAHFFFRNLQGLWACTNPSCSQAPTRSDAPPTGALHYVPTLTCDAARESWSSCIAKRVAKFCSVGTGEIRDLTTTNGILVQIIQISKPLPIQHRLSVVIYNTRYIGPRSSAPYSGRSEAEACAHAEAPCVADRASAEPARADSTAGLGFRLQPAAGRVCAWSLRPPSVLPAGQ
jgi:hypothetical protein